MPPMQSLERPPTHTTSQRQNGLNYQFNFGLLSADEPPAPHYENPTQVFQSSQQNLAIERHHPFHYIFYQILSWRIWKKLKQGVHLLHL